ncbi:MAG: hypothetical protein ACFB6R_18275 [Alphaproteobacteria bacterium]
MDRIGAVSARTGASVKATATGGLRTGAVLALVITVSGLGACANRTDPAIVNTASYQTGYSDGCATGNQRLAGFSNTVKRDKILFKTDEPYRIGWNQGYVTCGGRESPLSDDYLQDDRFDQGPI